MAWNRATGEYKYFVSNAPPHTNLELLLKVAFYRADVEYLFRVAKGEAGLSHFEGRSYVGLMRHMILCQLVMTFVAKQTNRLRGEKIAPRRAAEQRDHLGTGRAGAQYGLPPMAQSRLPVLAR